MALLLSAGFLAGAAAALSLPRLTPLAFSALRSCPGLSRLLKWRISQEVKSIQAAVRSQDQAQNPALGQRRCSLPARGWDQPALAAALDNLAGLERSRWAGGKVSGAVYCQDEAHRALTCRAFSLFAYSNPLHSGLFPAVRKMEAELVAMAADFQGGGDGLDIQGLVTSGGTESIFTAVLAHRNRWAREGEKAQVLSLPSAHPALAKACHYLGLELTLVPAGDSPGETTESFRRAITPRTILLYVSAPAYPHGEIDPVPEIAELARRQGLGCHVDACLGGFVLPWLRLLEPDIPAFDFASCPGVTSMSLDTHKYGLAPKGTSLVLFRGAELRQACSFATASWPGGIYASPGLAGSRPGGLVAAAWASLMALGQEGLAQQAAQLQKTRQAIVKAIETVPELEVIGRPLATVVAFKAKEGYLGPCLNIYQLAEAMRCRGWQLSPLQSPPALHICLCAPQAGREEEFAVDLAWSTREVLDNPEKYKGGMCASYGLAGDERVPRELVEAVAAGAVAID